MRGSVYGACSRYIGVCRGKTSETHLKSCGVAVVGGRQECGASIEVSEKRARHREFERGENEHVRMSFSSSSACWRCRRPWVCPALVPPGRVDCVRARVLWPRTLLSVFLNGCGRRVVQRGSVGGMGQRCACASGCDRLYGMSGHLGLAILGGSAKNTGDEPEGVTSHSTLHKSTAIPPGVLSGASVRLFVTPS